VASIALQYTGDVSEGEGWRCRMKVDNSRENCMESFETTTILDKLVYKELKKALQAPRWKIAMMEQKMQFTRHKYGAASKDCGFTTSFNDSGFVVKDMLDYGESALTTKESIGNNVVEFNHAGNLLMIVPYDEISLFIEAKSLYVIKPKAAFGWSEFNNSFGVINKTSIDEAGKRQILIDSLRQKCEKIKFVRA